MTYSAINIQGNILTSEILEKIRTEDIRFQNAKDFNLDPHTSVRDEISLAWSLAQSHWKAFQQKREKLSSTYTGTSDTRNYWMKPLMSILGFDLSSANAETINGKPYAISFRTSNLDNFPVHIVGINQSMDARAETGGPRLSPHALVQEYLNNQEHMYALVSNGKFLRLLRDATRLSRLSYLEFNLEQMMEESLYVEFALLFRILHASRMPQKVDAGAESILEFYHQEALASGSRIRERLSLAVETSIKELANGFLFHSQNEGLRDAISKNQVYAKDYYLYNLRIIYRLLFLMVIEERKLIFSLTRDKITEQQKEIYYKYYSVQRLCSLVEKMVYVDPKKTDLWQSLKTCFALFEETKYGGKLGIAPLGSGLFAHDSLGILSDQALNNEAFLKVLRHLVTFQNEGGQRVRVNYADLDVEEFGSVYEGLLEYEPQILDPATQPIFIFKEGKERSKSGSHYTPEELVKPLIKHSLDYLIDDKLKEPDPDSALLSLKVCDVACGSGHILLSAARRIGFELAKLRSKEDQPSPTVLRQAIRDVINHCIYGVDKNPLAVELCKVAMWLEAHNPGQPLNFLDHRIKCGDAIVGLAHRSELENGIADEAFKTLPGDDKDIAKSFRDRNVKERKERAAKASQLKAEFEKSTASSVQEAMAEYKTFNHLPETTPEEIERKAKAYKKFIDGKGFAFLKAMADTQVAQFFISKTASTKDYLMTDADFRLILGGYKGWQDRKVAKATAVALEQKFFHWFIEFPEVFNESGFDCILGNPPFLGGAKISSHFGQDYLTALHYLYIPAGGLCDLVAYFFRRAFSLLKPNGIQSLVATNSISQGDTRDGGLDFIIQESGQIVHGVKSMKWPGLAAVEVSLVSIVKGSRNVDKKLNGRTVGQISSYLDDSTLTSAPHTLPLNLNKCFNGSKIYGNGFLVEEGFAKRLIDLDDRYKKILFPYLIGEDLNDDFNQRPSRWVINFFDFPEKRYSHKEWMEISELEKEKVNERINLKKFIPIAPPTYTGDVAMDYPLCYEIVLLNVKPERQKVNRDTRRERWWIYGERAPGLYSEILNNPFCFATALTGKNLAFTKMRADIVFSHATGVISNFSFSHFCLIQNSFHELWAWKNCSSMGISLRYTPASAYETYPFPNSLNISLKNKLEGIGEEYHKLRRSVMMSIQLGLTKTYNLFHNNAITALSIDEKDKQVAALQKHLEKTANTISFDESIQGILKLRDLHVQMDEAVLNAYGWSDIVLRHDFYEIDYLPENDRIRYTIHPEARKEVLKRLLQLNHKIHAEEQALIEAKKIISKNSKKGTKTKQPSIQTLFSMRPETAYSAIYSAQDIARITKVSSKTIKRWLGRLYSEGYEGISKDNSTSGHPLLINFYGVHELIVLYDLRVVNKIPLKDILDARKWLIERFATGPNFYPFTSQKVLDTISKAGKQIIFTDEKTGDYITLGRGNGQLNLEFIKEILKRIVFDKEMVSRLYLSDSHLIAIDPSLAGGRPCTVQNEILIDSIKSVYLESNDIKYIASVYEISESAVQDALNFEQASVLN